MALKRLQLELLTRVIRSEIKVPQNKTAPIPDKMPSLGTRHRYIGTNSISWPQAFVRDFARPRTIDQMGCWNTVTPEPGLLRPLRCTSYEHTGCQLMVELLRGR